MGLFHFHLRLAGRLERDRVGVPFASLEAAYLQVCETIPVLAAELLREGHDLRTCTYLIADPAGTTLMEVPFRELERRPAAPPPLRPHVRRHAALVAAVVAEAAAVSRRASAAVLRHQAFMERMRQRAASVGGG